MHSPRGADSGTVPLRGFSSPKWYLCPRQALTPAPAPRAPASTLYSHTVHSLNLNFNPEPYNLILSEIARPPSRCSPLTWGHLISPVVIGGTTC